MKDILAGAGRRFLHAVAASLIVFVLGLLAAPDLVSDNVRLYGVAFLVAIGAAALKFIAEVIPFVSVANYVPDKYKVYAAWVDAFLQAGVAAFLRRSSRSTERSRSQDGRRSRRGRADRSAYRWRKGDRGSAHSRRASAYHRGPQAPADGLVPGNEKGSPQRALLSPETRPRIGRRLFLLRTILEASDGGTP